MKQKIGQVDKRDFFSLEFFDFSRETPEFNVCGKKQKQRTSNGGKFVHTNTVMVITSCGYREFIDITSQMC